MSTPPIHQTNPFEKMIDDQVALLARKGYDEARLQSFSNPGDYRQYLTRHVAQRVVESSWAEDERLAVLSVRGFFNNDREVVNFNISFRVLPVPPFFTLQALDATLDHVHRRYEFDRPALQLPTPGQVYKDLALQRKEMEEVLPPLKKQLPGFLQGKERYDLDHLCFEQRQLLQRAGYFPSTATGSMERFEHELRQQLLTGFERPPLTNHIFVIRQDRKYNGKGMRTRFCFQFIPDAMSLLLRAIQAQMGPISKAYMLSEKTDVITAGNIYLDLERARTLRRASQIVAENSATPLKTTIARRP